MALDDPLGNHAAVQYDVINHGKDGIGAVSSRYVLLTCLKKTIKLLLLKLHVVLLLLLVTVKAVCYYVQNY